MKPRLSPILVLLTALLLSGCAAEKLYRQGVAQIEKGQFEEGLELLRRAAQESPDDLQYRTALRRQRETVLNALLESAEQARREARHNEAEALLRRAGALDPGNTRSEAIGRDLARDRQLLSDLRQAERLAGSGRWDEAGEHLKRISLQNPELRGLNDLRTRVENERLTHRTTLPALKARQTRPVSLQFVDTPLRAVIEALSRDTGINVVLDREVRPDLRVTIFVQQVRVEDALDMILVPAQLEKKVLSDNTILIYPANPAKQKEYQDLLLRSFYIQNADIKQTMAMLKTILKLRDVFVDERVNLLVIRDTPDVVRMAERLIAAHDVPEPEVMLEVEVLEVTRSNDTSIGAKFPEFLTITDGKLVNRLNSNIQINLRSAEGRGNLLSNPRIRVKSRQKARVLIGERVPVVSSTTTPTQSGTTVALVSQQIQYLDIGLKLEVEPIVNLDDTVSIKLGLEVNTLGEKLETQTGAVAYRVGTRTTNTVLELKDGETQVLAGLIRDDDRRTANRLPIIGEFPLLDRIFGTVSTEGNKTEIVLSITPRLLRTVRRADVADQESWSGTESTFRTRPLMVQNLPGEGRGAHATGVANATGVMNATGSANLAAPASAAPPSGTPPAIPGGRVGGFGAPTPGAPMTAGTTTMGASPRLSWQAASDAKTGQEIAVTLNLQAATPISSALFDLAFDPATVEVLGVEQGQLLRSDNQPTAFDHSIDPAGRIRGGISRSSGTGVSGSGSIAVIRLRAKAGASAIGLQPATITAIEPGGRNLPIEAPPAFQATITP